VPALFWLLGESSGWVMLPWLSLPLALRLVSSIYRNTKGPALNKTLAATANLDLIFCVLFATGLVW
jgi:1,4-dihydroxy-2-naphthoate octaprenyltransferase